MSEPTAEFKKLHAYLKSVGHPTAYNVNENWPDNYDEHLAGNLASGVVPEQPDKVDAFFKLYKRVVDAGVPLPKVKFVKREDRTSFPDDGVLRLDDRGDLIFKADPATHNGVAIVCRKDMSARAKVGILMMYKTMYTYGIFAKMMESEWAIPAIVSLTRCMKSNATDEG